MGKMTKEEFKDRVEFWVARDKDGGLFAYPTKPERSDMDKGWWDSYVVDKKTGDKVPTGIPPYNIPGFVFCDLKWEDEPLECEMALKPIRE